MFCANPTKQLRSESQLGSLLLRRHYSSLLGDEKLTTVTVKLNVCSSSGKKMALSPAEITQLNYQ